MSTQKTLRTTGKPKAAKLPKEKAPATGPATRAVRWARGTVVSDKMNKTRVVKVDRQVQEPFYKKYVVRSKKYKAHDEKNDARLGDVVMMVETRPLSSGKRWVITEVVRRGGHGAIAKVEV
jgi:small subunit ribosomal protein S17